MRLLFAPVWLIRAVEAAGQDRTVLLNIPKLLGIVSLEDVKVYCQVNNNLSSVLPNPIADTFHNVDLLGLCDHDSWDAITDLEQLQRTIKGMDSRKADAALTKYKLEANMLDERTLLVYQTSIEGETEWLTFYEGILSTLNTFCPFSEIVREPIMLEYLKMAKQGMAA